MRLKNGLRDVSFCHTVQLFDWKCFKDKWQKNTSTDVSSDQEEAPLIVVPPWHHPNDGVLH